MLAAGRKVFRDFLRGEYSEENIMFWLACEELKRETDPDAIEEKARFIYEDYISILSPKEVSDHLPLDHSHLVIYAVRNIKQLTMHYFWHFYVKIYILHTLNYIPRYHYTILQAIYPFKALFRK